MGCLDLLHQRPQPSSLLTDTLGGNSEMIWAGNSRVSTSSADVWDCSDFTPDACVQDAWGRDTLSPYQTGCGCASSDGPCSAELGLYCLARLDDATGLPLRVATDKEAEELGRILALSGNTHLLGVDSSSGELFTTRSGGSGASARSSCGWRGGGPCDHCRATESPQWRRGPPSKPVLCNACGTRYRRTGQLGPPGPAASVRKAPSLASERKRYKTDNKEGMTRLVFCEAA